jgi:hypothetical protein
MNRFYLAQERHQRRALVNIYEIYGSINSWIFRTTNTFTKGTLLHVLFLWGRGVGTDHAENTAPLLARRRVYRAVA